MKKLWAMPDYLEKYRDDIHSTGGNDIEELMNDKDTNLSNNSIRAMIIMGVRCQINLLETLHKKQMLA